MRTQKNKTWNSSIFGSIIAALCIVIYLGALIQGAVRLYLSAEKTRAAAEMEFSQIKNTALSVGANNFMDDVFIRSMNSALSSTKTIEGLIISGPIGVQAFEKQMGHAVSWVNNSPRFINRFGFSNQDYHEPLFIINVRDASIKAIASAFDYYDFSNILKETLLLILIGFVLASITMLLQLLFSKPAAAQLPARKEAPAASESSPALKAAKETHVETEEETEEELSTAGSDDEDGPKGLYSSRSNIGWEEYTMDRLNSELHRCSSTENDLSLILLEFAEIHNDAVFKQAAGEAVSFFASRDLIFENGAQGISVILPGVGLDTAIAKSEKFYQRISASSLNIGLSSRSGRLINADRLMLEAAEALKKAKKDPAASIIAFKSDPEKYREFIRTRK